MTRRDILSSHRLEILWEDPHLIVVNKPPGVSAVHDSNRPLERTAVELLQATYGEVLTVHRIDRDTSGILLAARTEESHRNLSAQFEGHTVQKAYQCLVRGTAAWESRVVDAPLRVNAGRAYRTIVDEVKGKPATTAFTVVERFRGLTLVVAEPVQGRRHQIRAHLEHLGQPIVCDSLYGDERPLLLSEMKRGYRPSASDERPLLNRLGLHAERLSFTHPWSGTRTTVVAPLARDIEVTLKQLRRWAPG